MADVRLVEAAGQGRVDVTVGSALDLFGGSGVTFAELVAWNRRPNSGGSNPKGACASS
jgi:phosphoribosylformimino-5-aminoimidazole carboxamide ribotide isomerase